jgi:hypothetical protein
MRPQSSIYSAEQQPIITAMENTTQTNKPMIIATDSLCLLLAALETDGLETRKRGISGD